MGQHGGEVITSIFHIGLGNECGEETGRSRDTDVRQRLSMWAGPLAVGVWLASFTATSRLLPLAKLSALYLSGSVLFVPLGCDCDGPSEGRL